MKLLYRIMILTLAVAVISLTVTGWRLIQLNLNVQRTAVLEDHNQRAVEISQLIDENYINIWVNSLGTVSATQQLYDLGTQERKALILALVNEYEDIDALLLFDDQNKQIVSAFEENILEEILANPEKLMADFVNWDNDEVIFGAQMDDVYFSKPFKSEILASPYINLAIKTPIGNDKFGTLIGKISLQNLQKMIYEKQFRKNGIVYLADNKGQLITHTDFDKILTPIPEKPMVKAFVDAPMTGGSSPYMENNIEMLGAYAPIFNLPWAVIIEEPAADAYLAVTKMKREMFKWFLFAIVISIIGALLISRNISNPISDVADGSEEIAKGNFDFQLTKNTTRKDEIGQLTNSFNRMAKSLKEKEQIKGAFSRFVPPLVVQEILKDLDNLELGGRRTKISVMFVDIRGFTAISEVRPAEEVVDVLNKFLDKMLKIVFEYQGTLDKFLGDGFMAFWGAPMEHEDDGLRSVKAALEMQSIMVDFNKICKEEYNLELNIGIGVNFGEAIVGNTGAESRMEYTAVGAVVNAASRLCGIAKPGQIIISQSLFEEVKDEINCDALPPVKLKGIEKPFPIFDVKKA